MFLVPAPCEAAATLLRGCAEGGYPVQLQDNTRNIKLVLARAQFDICMRISHSMYHIRWRCGQPVPPQSACTVHLPLCSHSFDGSTSSVKRKTD